MANILFYKGEDIQLTFTSESDMSGYTKVVKYFTPYSTIKTATLQVIDTKNFKATFPKEDTLDLTPGKLNIVLEFTASNGKIISKSIDCRIADPYLDGNARTDVSTTSDIVFIDNSLSLNINFLAGGAAVSGILFNKNEVNPDDDGLISINAVPMIIQHDLVPYISASAGDKIRITGTGGSAGIYVDYICIKSISGGDASLISNKTYFITNEEFVSIFKNTKSFTASTQSFIVPTLEFKVAKYTSNYASGNAVLIDFPIFNGKTPIIDDDRLLVLMNAKSSDVTFVVNTGDDVVGSNTFSYILEQSEELILSQNQHAEISYLFAWTSETTCKVLIRWIKEE